MKERVEILISKEQVLKRVNELAEVIMKDYEIFLVYKNSSYYIASKAFTTLKKGIHSVREGEI